MRKNETGYDTTGLIVGRHEWADDPKYIIDTNIDELVMYSAAELGVIRQGQIERSWGGLPTIEIKVILDSYELRRIFIETHTRDHKEDGWKLSGLSTTEAKLWLIEIYNLKGERHRIIWTMDDMLSFIKRNYDDIEHIQGYGIYTRHTKQYKRGYSIPYDVLLKDYAETILGFSSVEFDRNEGRNQYNKI